ncbi:MAG: hypothetical protein O7C67_08305 [Gammaproteobacteria bacterium]|nr:hypothetical protein [Gammaproteobacteria bacterium]
MRCLIFVVTVFLLVIGGAARAQEQDDNIPPTIAQQYAQVWLGTTDADGAWSVNDPGTNSEVPGDYSSLPLGGGASQRLWGKRGQLGFEGGALVSWKNDDVEFAGSNGMLAVSIDTELFMMDVFMGGVVGVRLTRWLRLYVAAGPSIAWGYLPSEDNDEDEVNGGPIVTGPGSVVIIDLDSSESDVSFALYGRVGIDIELDSGFTFGVSARYAEHEFDFDQRGDLKLDKMQWFLTLGSKI